MRGRTRGITAFLAIAFGLAWLPYIPALFGADPFGGLLMPIVAAVACVVVRRWVTREGFADAGLRPNLRHSWRLGLLAAAWPLVATPLAVVIVIAIVIGVGPGGLSLPWGLAALNAVSILGWLLGSIAGAAIFLGEELGWRGYLQIRFVGRVALQGGGCDRPDLGVWHHPLILTGGEPTTVWKP